MAAAADLAACDAACRSIFQLLEAFPRFKDQVVDQLQAEALVGGSSADDQEDGAAAKAYAQNYAPESGGAAARGALVIRGAPKMLQMVAMIVQRGKAPTTADRFKPFVQKCKWVPVAALPEALEGVEGVEGLQERHTTYDPARQYVAVVIAELADGELRCQHTTGTGVPSVDDRGMWEYVLDHGKSRTAERPKFLYNGSLMPYRVSPDRPVPEHIPKPDYYSTGQAEAERRSESRTTPPVLTEKQIKKLRKASSTDRAADCGADCATDARCAARVSVGGAPAHACRCSVSGLAQDESGARSPLPPRAHMLARAASCARARAHTHITHPHTS